MTKQLAEDKWVFHGGLVASAESGLAAQLLPHLAPEATDGATVYVGLDFFNSELVRKGAPAPNLDAFLNGAIGGPTLMAVLASYEIELVRSEADHHIIGFNFQCGSCDKCRELGYSVLVYQVSPNNFTVERCLNNETLGAIHGLKVEEVAEAMAFASAFVLHAFGGAEPKHRCRSCESTLFQWLD